jgi:SAM-dependent methyltransferase
LVLKTDLFDEAFGDGLATWFEARGNRVVGCDLAFSTARSASEGRRGQGNVVSDVLHLPFADGRFDCIVSDSTLDHFDSEDQIQFALKELSRVLSAGGTLLLTMDNPRHPLVAVRNLFPALWRKLGTVPYSVGATCSASRLRQLLESAGFEVVGLDGILHVPRVLAVALCGWLERYRGVREPKDRWIGWLECFESLRNLPSWQWTGHFIAAVARKPV